MLKSKDKAKLNTKHYYIIYLRYLLFFGIVNLFSLDFRIFFIIVWPLVSSFSDIFVST